MSNKNKLTDKVPKGFIGEIKFFTKGILFGVVNMKKPLKEDIAFYMFLFQVMKEQFKDDPDLKIGKFAELFENFVAAEGLEKAEEHLMEIFGGEFTMKLKKNG